MNNLVTAIFYISTKGVTYLKEGILLKVFFVSTRERWQSLIKKMKIQVLCMPQMAIM
ncbi:hypothetical protein C900_01493 [Fulvivirga imtechensis AK7]|uniref:Uncharacterized protein n=1 Tax=Fulvivirga imtechensis AK7 TaxID=1237149 RepID=L8JWB9_9BACT|nr:hypothetical protein C900_01493 [Fulvivirga imtechensis AK7]